MSFFNSQIRNIKKIDSNIRLVLSFLILIFAVYSQCYLLMLLAMVLAYTALKGYCFLYELFKVNEKFSLKNYYMSHLPKYNPSAVFIFDKNGKITFKNDSAKNNFAHILNLDDFKIGDFKKEIEDTYYHKHDNKHYQLNVREVAEIASILVYVTDIVR